MRLSLCEAGDSELRQKGNKKAESLNYEHLNGSIESNAVPEPPLRLCTRRVGSVGGERGRSQKAGFP